MEASPSRSMTHRPVVSNEQREDTASESMPVVTQPTQDEANTQASKGKRSASWVSDKVDGVSVEQKLVDWLCEGENYSRLKVKDAADRLRQWDRLAEKWAADGHVHRTSNQVQSKVDELFKKYRQACGWADHTGQGIKDVQGADAYDKQLQKMCKYYNQLDETLGERSGFRSKRSLGNLAANDQAFDELLGLRAARAVEKAKRKATENEEGDDSVDTEADKAKRRQRMRTNAVSTSNGPINLDAPPPKSPRPGSDEEVEVVQPEPPMPGRGKGKGNAFADGFQTFLAETTQERKSQLDLMRKMQEKKEKREEERDRLRKLKEFRALAEVLDKDTAWKEVFGTPLSGSQSQRHMVSTTATLLPNRRTDLMQHDVEPDIQGMDGYIGYEDDNLEQ